MSDLRMALRSIAFVHECDGGCGAVLFDETICRACAKKMYAEMEKLNRMYSLPRIPRRYVTIADVIGTILVAATAIAIFIVLMWGSHSLLLTLAKRLS